MAQQRQNEQRNALASEPEAARRGTLCGPTVEVLLAVLMAIAVGGLITQCVTEYHRLMIVHNYARASGIIVAWRRPKLWLSSATEDDTPGQMVVRQDGALIPVGSDMPDDTTISALRKAKAENTTLQQKVAQLEDRLEAAAATAAKRDAEVIATRAPTSSECEDAIRDGDVDVLKQAKRSGDSIDAIRKNKNACSSAAKNGHLEVLQWLRANGCPWDETACSDAAMNGHVEVLQWLRANGCPWNKWACSQAAMNGHLEVLQWLRANGCPWNEKACSLAARDGHLEVLQWLRANGCPWDETACSEAAMSGHLEVLQWLCANGCPSYSDT